MSEEQVFLNEGDLFVSNTRVNIGGQTYATANITAVSSKTIPPSKRGAIVLIIIGAIFAMIGFGSFSASVGAGIVLLIIAGIFLAGGILWLRSLKPTYTVMVGSAGGEKEALSSKDGEIIDGVVAAINDAIIARG